MAVTQATQPLHSSLRSRGGGISSKFWKHAPNRFINDTCDCSWHRKRVSTEGLAWVQLPTMVGESFLTGNEFRRSPPLLTDPTAELHHAKRHHHVRGGGWRFCAAQRSRRLHGGASPCVFVSRARHETRMTLIHDEYIHQREVCVCVSPCPCVSLCLCGCLSHSLSISPSLGDVGGFCSSSVLLSSC